MTTLEFWDLCRNLCIPTVEYTINSNIADEWIAKNQEVGEMYSEDFKGEIYVKFLNKDEHYIEFEDGWMKYHSESIKNVPIELFQLVDRLGSGRINYYTNSDSSEFQVIDYEE